jgi:hypothetical protein
VPAQAPEGRSSTYLQRHRALLESILALTHQQRRCLIDGDVLGLEEANRLLGVLLDSSEVLRGDLPQPTGPADRAVLADLRELTSELQRESRVNYILACRGEEFAQHTLDLIQQAVGGDGPTAAGQTGESAAPRPADRVGQEQAPAIQGRIGTSDGPSPHPQATSTRCR